MRRKKDEREREKRKRERVRVRKKEERKYERKREGEREKERGREREKKREGEKDHAAKERTSRKAANVIRPTAFGTFAIFARTHLRIFLDGKRTRFFYLFFSNGHRFKRSHLQNLKPFGRRRSDQLKRKKKRKKEREREKNPAPKTADNGRNFLLEKDKCF